LHDIQLDKDNIFMPLLGLDIVNLYLKRENFMHYMALGLDIVNLSQQELFMRPIIHLGKDVILEKSQTQATYM
jgi:hypothetical protein